MYLKKRLFDKLNWVGSVPGSGDLYGLMKECINNKCQRL